MNDGDNSQRTAAEENLKKTAEVMNMMVAEIGRQDTLSIFNS